MGTQKKEKKERKFKSLSLILGVKLSLVEIYSELILLSFILPKIFTEYLLCIRHWGRHCGRLKDGSDTQTVTSKSNKEN